MAVSVFNMLLGGTLPGTDFGNPESVMRGLNSVFEMERQGGHYFTIWYAVYHTSSRTLTFSGGGHPPALLRSGTTAQETTVRQLECSGLPIGMMANAEFENVSVGLPAFAQLLLYSDGAVEITQPNGEVVEYTEFYAFTEQSSDWGTLMDQAIARARHLRGAPTLADDCSLVQFEF